MKKVPMEHLPLALFSLSHLNNRNSSIEEFYVIVNMQKGSLDGLSIFYFSL